MELGSTRALLMVLFLAGGGGGRYLVLGIKLVAKLVVITCERSLRLHLLIAILHNKFMASSLLWITLHHSDDLFASLNHFTFTQRGFKSCQTPLKHLSVRSFWFLAFFSIGGITRIDFCIPPSVNSLLGHDNWFSLVCYGFYFAKIMLSNFAFGW